MNKIFFCTVATILLFSALCIQGQQMTRDEIESLARASKDRLHHISYVHKYISQILPDGVMPSLSIERTSEYNRDSHARSPGRSHFTSTIVDVAKTTYYEQIWIGGVHYTRKDLGEWTIDTPAAPAANDPSSSGNETPPKAPTGNLPERKYQVDQKTEFLGEESVGGVSALKYRITETRTTPGATYYAAGFLIYTYWFDKDKRLVKLLVETSDTGTKRILRMSDEYIYDTEIKIEAPIKTEDPIK